MPRRMMSTSSSCSSLVAASASEAPDWLDRSSIAASGTEQEDEPRYSLPSYLKYIWICYKIYIIVNTYEIFVGPRTHLRGQNVPLDSMVLMEREAKRAQALRVQAEVLKQLKEREDRKREELERKKIEERQRDKQLAEQRQR